MITDEKNLGNKEIRAIFMGSPDFAIPALEALASIKNLANKDFKIVGVFTQPDKPVGRKQIITPPPVKVVAEKLGLKVLQPLKLRTPESFELVKDLTPDLIIVVAYGKIIPKNIIDLPRFGVINIHGSLLPKYRGASPIQAAILNGEKETGVSIMLIDEEMDHGPILAEEKIKISEDETGESLFQKLAPQGAKLLTEVLPKWINGEIKPIEQNHELATFTKILSKDDGKIDWQKSASEIERQLRAFWSWPGSWTIWQKENDHIKLNFIKGRVIKSSEDYEIGTVFKTKDGFAIKTGKDGLEVLELQPEGKTKMFSKDFLNGHKEIINSKLN